MRFAVLQSGKIQSSYFKLKDPNSNQLQADLANKTLPYFNRKYGTQLIATKIGGYVHVLPHNGMYLLGSASGRITLNQQMDRFIGIYNAKKEIQNLTAEEEKDWWLNIEYKFGQKKNPFAQHSSPITSVMAHNPHQQDLPSMPLPPSLPPLPLLPGHTTAMLGGPFTMMQSHVKSHYFHLTLN